MFEYIRGICGRRFVKVNFAGHMLILDTRWKHERDYLDYIRLSRITGPLAMDAWAFSHFVKPGDIVLDAGANIGFTSLLAEKAGAVEIHSFEPDPRLLSRLKTHCQGDQFVIYGKALGEKQSVMQMFLSAQHNQGSTLNNKWLSKFPEVYRKAKVIQVDVVTLDSLFGEKYFDFFKIDVEGAEIATLKGASAILKIKPPESIYVEVYDEFFTEVHEFLNNYYRYAYRIVCDSSGSCRLFPADLSLQQMQSEDYFMLPPSYIYTMAEQEELTKTWTQPAYAVMAKDI